MATLTMFKWTIRWHQVRSRCCIRISTIYFHNFRIIPETLPIQPQPQPLLTAMRLSLRICLLWAPHSAVIQHCALLCLASYLLKPKVFKAHPRGGTWQNFLPLEGRGVFRRVHVPPWVHCSAHGHVGCCPPVATESSAPETRGQVSVSAAASNSFHLRRKLRDRPAILMNFRRNRQTVGTVNSRGPMASGGTCRGPERRGRAQGGEMSAGPNWRPRPGGTNRLRLFRRRRCTSSWPHRP